MQLKQLKSFKLFILLLILSFYTAPVFSQPLFQNSNFPCEEVPIVGSFSTVAVSVIPNVGQSIVTGSFNDDSALDHPDFPDAFAARSPLPSVNDTSVPAYTLLSNTGAHSLNHCFNLGGDFQFDALDSTNTSPEMITASATEALVTGSLAVGNVDNAAFDDVTHTIVRDQAEPENAARFLESVLSQASGGFAASLLGVGTFLEDPAAPAPLKPMPSNTFGVVENSLYSETSLAMGDCNGDGLDDALVFVNEQQVGEIVPSIMVLPNDGLGGFPTGDTLSNLIALQAVMGPASTATGSLGLEDFNDDGNLDIAVAVGSPQGNSYAGLCLGDGACGFACPLDPADINAIDLRVQCPGGVGDINCSILPRALVIGDFDGNGDPDFALAEQEALVVGLQSTNVHYFLNNGGDFSTWDNPSLPFVFGNNAPNGIAAGRFSTTAVQQAVDEVAVNISVSDAMAMPLPPGLLVIPTDGSGGFVNNTDQLLLYNDPASTLAGGVSAADVDHCGGDDLLGVYVTSSSATQVVSRVGLFLNVNEPPQLNVTGPSIAQTGQVLQFDGTCSDPTLDDRVFRVIAENFPAGANISLTPNVGGLLDPEENFNFTFSSDRGGSYALRVECEDFCGEVISQNLNINLPVSIQETPEIPETTLTLTQGSCIASLDSTAKPNAASFITALLLLFFPLLLFLSKKFIRA